MVLHHGSRAPAPPDGSRALCRIGAAVAGGAFRVDPQELAAATRRRKRVAWTRQAAMYHIHVGFGIDFTATGRGFGRDRTTVRHACALIEGARDAEPLDRALDQLEHSLRAYVDFIGDLARPGVKREGGEP
jgi:hypothetical protein